MKIKFITILGLLALCLQVNAQTDTTNAPAPPSSFLGDLKINLGNVTNYAAVIYGTYAPKAPTTKGGGFLLVYNVNNYVGVAAGADWLGKFNMCSGNVTLKLPTHPLSFLHWGWNPALTPNVIGGIGVPFGGANSANGGVAGIAGVGANLDIYTFKGFTIGAGYELVNWSSADKYSGKHHELFLDLHKGF